MGRPSLLAYDGNLDRRTDRGGVVAEDSLRFIHTAI